MRPRWPTLEQWAVVGVGALFVFGALVGGSPRAVPPQDISHADAVLFSRLAILLGAGCFAVGLVSILRSWRRE